MPHRRASLLQGTLDLLILKALVAGELRGLGVSRRIEQITSGTFAVQPGSLFPALHRLEEAGWLVSTWEASSRSSFSRSRWRRATCRRVVPRGSIRCARSGASSARAL